jgi:3-isopropylmalate/(R)-2-methylmalate dehydratase large subunit
MPAPRTISEKILGAHAGRDVRAGDVVVCEPDLIVGTDASAPMAIDYFEAMGGASVFDPARVVFSLDHYAPPTLPATQGFHARLRKFAECHRIEVFGRGEGISHQVIVERGRARPGMLIAGADSHTVTCGALNLFATGVGSSDLAAAMITGTIWFRVPETIRVALTGERPAGLAAKDVALVLIGTLGTDGADYRALEFAGAALETFPLEDRLVLSSLAVEAGAKAAIFPCDALTTSYLAGRTTEALEPVASDPGARIEREIRIDLSALSPRVARPHSPNDVVEVGAVVGTSVQMAFIGTCTGGRVSDIHAALRTLDAHGGRIAPTVRLVITPASEEVRRRLADDGSLARLERMGATITMPGCGACCGTSGVLPDEGATVISTANRNFRSRMGVPSASIFLASPEACAAAAATGRIVDPREVSS